MAGSIYNAVLSVDINELDYLDTITLTNGGITTLNNSQTPVNEMFGLNVDTNGVINIKGPEEESSENMDKIVQQQVINKQKQIQDIRKNNPNTNLSNEQLLDLYNEFNGDGFFIN